MGHRTRERRLETTAEIVQRRGSHGASSNDILDESGTPRGSLYHHFLGGEEQLVREAAVAEELASVIEAAMPP